jgi:SAM-dependent methyltransferase
MTEQRCIDPLEYTGERMVPELCAPCTFWEHIYRYRFASRYVRGKRVLDIACGEGYGSAALLAAGAASLVGVDVCQTTCDHARRKYGIDARVGSAEAIPVPAGSVDLVVSFETIEHLPEPALFLDECRRVLGRGGSLVISTPNRAVYREVSVPNPFHCSEMSQEEFVTLLADRFAGVRLFTQRPRTAAWWAPRSFSAEASFWTAGPRRRRLLEILLKLQCPHFISRRATHFREAPVRTVLARDLPLTGWLNPYVVRRQNGHVGEKAYYLVAVADL